MKVEIERENLDAAYAAGCKDVRKVLRALFPGELDETKKFKIGDTVKDHWGTTFIVIGFKGFLTSKAIFEAAHGFSTFTAAYLVVSLESGKIYQASLEKAQIIKRES